MTTIDIRTAAAPVTGITVAAASGDYYVADKLTKRTPTGGIEVQDSHTNRSLRVCDREHAENLIKGLQKAIELGWV